jgi:hypothetical protein
MVLSLGRVLRFSIHVLKFRIKISCFTAITKNDIFSWYLLTFQSLIIYVCSAQNITRRMSSEEERLARLRRTLHSLATRVPKIILTPVDWIFPVLKIKAVSVTHSVMDLYMKHLCRYVSSCRNYIRIYYCTR